MSSRNMAIFTFWETKNIPIFYGNLLERCLRTWNLNVINGYLTKQSDPWAGRDVLGRSRNVNYVEKVGVLLMD